VGARVSMGAKFGFGVRRRALFVASFFALVMVVASRAQASDATFYNLGGIAPHTRGPQESRPVRMTADGSVVIGQSTNSNGVDDWTEAFVWTSGGGMQGLGVLGVWVLGELDVSYGGDDRFSSSYLMSADGSVIAGQSSNSNGVDDWVEAFRWTSGGGMQGLGVLGTWTNGDRSSFARAMSADGSVIAGVSSNSNGLDNWEEAFRWTSDGGMQGLGVLGVHTGGGLSGILCGGSVAHLS